MRIPIRVRLTMLHVAVIAVVLSALGAYLVLRLPVDLTNDIDQSLTRRAGQIAQTYQANGTANEFAEVSNAALAGLAGGDSGAQLLSTTGQIQDSSDDVIGARPIIGGTQLAWVLTHGSLRATVPLREPAALFRVYAQPVTVGGQQHILVVATSVAGVNAAKQRLLAILLTGGPLALIVVGAIGWWLTSAALRPVASMTEQARRISVDQLDERLPPGRVADEVGRLATTLNEMLDRLQAGIQAQQRLVADASHDLRTPLAVMRAELDLALAGDQPPTETAEVLSSTSQEVDRMIRIVENLLALARIDQGRLTLLSQPVDLREEADAIALRFASVAQAKGLTITVTGDNQQACADRQRLAQLISNLVDNAVKYTESGGVCLDVWRGPAEVGLTVSDTGPGIPPAELSRVFSRFYRVDSARSAAPGSGLGLAIAREIVHAHGGRIWADGSPHGGCRIAFALPTTVAVPPT